LGAPTHAAALQPSDIAADAVIIRLQQGTPAEWKAFYVDAIRTMKPGLTVLLVHLGYDDAELRAVTVGYDVFDSKWRQMDYDVMTSPEFKQALKDNDVVLVTWRDIQKAMYPTP
jgi:hypothetical protein